MLRLFGLALVASALVLIPATFSSQQYSGQALAEASAPAEKAKPAKKKRRELTKGQKAARERARQCGREWKELKSAGKIEKGQTWPKFWSACNKRLKSKSG
jgi:hypothetical protein